MSVTRIEVDMPSLARDLGLTRRQREDIATSGLVNARKVKGRTQVSDDDAEMIRQAVMIAAIAGVGILLVLRLLASGAVKPNIPQKT